MQGLQDKFGDILVPTEEVVEMRDGAKRKSDRKFFPGYVLVQMEMDEGTWHLVKEVPKVLGFIGGTPEKPAPITDKEAMGILRRVEEGVDKPKPKVLFEPGEVVRVIEGPFNDFNGVVESVNYEKNRLQVAVQILGRSTPVELDFSQVEKLAEGRDILKRALDADLSSIGGVMAGQSQKLVEARAEFQQALDHAAFAERPMQGIEGDVRLEIDQHIGDVAPDIDLGHRIARIAQGLRAARARFE